LSYDPRKWFKDRQFRKVKVARAASFIFHLQWGNSRCAAGDAGLRSLALAQKPGGSRRSFPHPCSHSPSGDEESGTNPRASFDHLLGNSSPSLGKTQARLLRKWKLYQRIHELHDRGMSLRKIGEELLLLTWQGGHLVENAKETLLLCFLSPGRWESRKQWIC
jgi:hypothetical protein